MSSLPRITTDLSFSSTAAAPDPHLLAVTAKDARQGEPLLEGRIEPSSTSSCTPGLSRCGCRAPNRLSCPVAEALSAILAPLLRRP